MLRCLWISYGSVRNSTVDLLIPERAKIGFLPNTPVVSWLQVEKAGYLPRTTCFLDPTGRGFDNIWRR